LHQDIVFSIAGAKVRLFLESPKLFATFFQKIRKNIGKSLRLQIIFVSLQSKYTL